MKKILPLLCWSLLILKSVAADPDAVFRNPPVEAYPRAMWMWMGCNLSKTQITRDLESMKDAGFGGTVMFSVADTTTPWSGVIGKSPTPGIIAFTPPWWELVRHAAMESNRLGLDFGMAASPGYSTSGGPWITPELSMPEICYSETPAQGPKTLPLSLAQPTVDPRGNMRYPVFDPETGKPGKPVIPARKTFYRDIAVLALPAHGVVAKDQVIDLTGKSEWQVPAGEWTIYRFGYTTKGILLQPPQWQANGLEVDKLNPEAVSFHLDHVLGEIKANLGDLVGHGFNYLHVDSYEAGVPEWTPRMREEFKARRGYDLTPFLATRAKRVIGSEAETKKYQDDFQETLRDLFRDVYYTLLQQKIKAAGLELSSEPYGGEWRQDDVVPKLDRVMVEFWTRKPVWDRGGQGTIAAQRKTGRNLIESEAFTGWPNESQWSEYPAALKPIGDGAFCGGINRLVLHRMVPQPWDDRYKPGNGMGWWGTHFDRTQTWWEPGKAMVRYWQRCQALLQWGKWVSRSNDFLIVSENPGIKPDFIHRGSAGTDLYFLANTDSKVGGTIECSLPVSDRQPEWWDAVTGTQRDLPEFRVEKGRTILPLTLAPTQSGFLVFRKKCEGPTNGKNFPGTTTAVTINGPWKVSFDPQWGGPKEAEFKTLEDWTQRPEPGIKYYSGTAVYRTTFDAPHAKHVTGLELGTVQHIARVKLNDRDLGVVWCAPWRVELPADLLKPSGNALAIEVTNVWANRLIGDEQEPPDCEWIPSSYKPEMGGSLKEFPDWFLQNKPRPSKGRYCFVTWNYFNKDSPLVASGLLGPVRLLGRD